MERIIKTVTDEYSVRALELVEKVFTEYENEAEGKLVRRLVEEIRSKKYYLPELELIMTDEHDEIIGYVMFSRFHIEGKYDDKLLILTPAAVKTELQRQHISKDLIEHGLAKAAALGYKAVIVEGNPRNYNPRGFSTAANYGIVPGPNMHLPHIDCLMALELVPGGLDGISGTLDYSFYDTLT